MHLVNTPISPDFTETLPGLLTSVRELALEAGDIALSFFRSG
ncbi:MAG: hypothetical protein RL543_1244, partial [Pseudomonadota bacterium]